MPVSNEYEFNQVRNNSAAWRELVAQLKALPGSDICWRCGQKIPLDVPNNDPKQWTADHVQSMENGGSALELSNLRPAHRSCNSKRGRNLQINYRLSRNW